MRALCLILIAGCNSILGNSDFTGPGGGSSDASPNAPDACVGASCAPAIDASMACEQMSLPPTSISGTIFAPNGTLPLPDVLVYVPTTPLDTLPAGATCGACGSEVSGTPLVQTRTDASGKFRLDDVPVGTEVPVVIQIGKWRRQVKVSTTACMNTVMSAADSRLPKNRQEGDVPHIAVVTGASDTLECIVRKIGIDDNEISTRPGNGRIHLFNQNGTSMFASGFPTQGTLSPSSVLVNDGTILDDYDMVLFGCSADPTPPAAAQIQNVVDYANKGGRVMLVHFQYSWMDAGAWNGIGTFNMNGTLGGNGNITIDAATPRGSKLAQWYAAVSGNGGNVVVTDDRNSCQGHDPTKAERWAYLDPAKNGGQMGDQILAFSTPVGAPQAQQCGQVAFSDLHEGSGNNNAFPLECQQLGLNTQDYLLIYMFFKLGDCPG